MQNDEGHIVDLYIPRKCSATNRLITAKDHASVQIEIAEVSIALAAFISHSSHFVAHASRLTFERVYLGRRGGQNDRKERHPRPCWFHAPERRGRRVPQQIVRRKRPPLLQEMSEPCCTNWGLTSPEGPSFIAYVADLLSPATLSQTVLNLANSLSI